MFLLEPFQEKIKFSSQIFFLNLCVLMVFISLLQHRIAAQTMRTKTDTDICDLTELRFLLVLIFHYITKIAGKIANET